MRLISWVIVLIFSLEQLAQAAPMHPIARSLSQVISPVSIEQLISDPSQLNIPFEFATVQEIHRGKGDKLIIHIQDAHSNYSGQMNLAKTLGQLMRQYDIPLVLAEGSAREVTLNEVKKIASLKQWRIAAKRFLLDGVIQGEEYLNLTQNNSMRIMGIEYQDLYQQNLRAYAKLKDKRQPILDHIRQSQNALNRIKNQLYPKTLLDYEQIKKESQDIHFKTQINTLLKLSNSNVNTVSAQQQRRGNLSSIQHYQHLQNQESQLNFERINHEQNILMEQLSSQGMHDQIKAHTLQATQAKDSPIAQNALLKQLFRLAGEVGVSTQALSELTKYMQYLEDFTQLNLSQLMDEVNDLETDVYSQLLESEDASKIRAIDRYLELIKKAFMIQLSSVEYQTLLNNEVSFPTRSWEAFANQMLMQLGYYDELIAHSTELDESITILKEFYDLVDQRDAAFLENSNRIMREQNQNIAFIISGGYHTEHITQLLQEQGNSYIVLTPNVTMETDYQQYEYQLLSTLNDNEDLIIPQRSSLPASPPPVERAGARRRVARSQGAVIASTQDPVIARSAKQATWQSNSDHTTLRTQHLLNEDLPIYQHTYAKQLNPGGIATDKLTQAARLSIQNHPLNDLYKTSQSQSSRMVQFDDGKIIYDLDEKFRTYKEIDSLIPSITTRIIENAPGLDHKNLEDTLFFALSENAFYHGRPSEFDESHIQFIAKKNAKEIHIRITNNLILDENIREFPQSINGHLFDAHQVGEFTVPIKERDVERTAAEESDGGFGVAEIILRLKFLYAAIPYARFPQSPVPTVQWTADTDAMKVHFDLRIPLPEIVLAQSLRGVSIEDGGEDEVGRITAKSAQVEALTEAESKAIELAEVWIPRIKKSMDDVAEYAYTNARWNNHRKREAAEAAGKHFRMIMRHVLGLPFGRERGGQKDLYTTPAGFAELKLPSDSRAQEKFLATIGEAIVHQYWINEKAYHEEVGYLDATLWRLTHKLDMKWRYDQSIEEARPDIMLTRHRIEVLLSHSHKRAQITGRISDAMHIHAHLLKLGIHGDPITNAEGYEYQGVLRPKGDFIWLDMDILIEQIQNIFDYYFTLSDSDKNALLEANPRYKGQKSQITWTEYLDWILLYLTDPRMYLNWGGEFNALEEYIEAQKLASDKELTKEEMRFVLAYDFIAQIFSKNLNQSKTWLRQNLKRNPDYLSDKGFMSFRTVKVAESYDITEDTYWNKSLAGYREYAWKRKFIEPVINMSVDPTTYTEKGGRGAYPVVTAEANQVSEWSLREMIQRESTLNVPNVFESIFPDIVEGLRKSRMADLGAWEGQVEALSNSESRSILEEIEEGLTTELAKLEAAALESADDSRFDPSTLNTLVGNLRGLFVNTNIAEPDSDLDAPIRLLMLSIRNQLTLIRTGFLSQSPQMRDLGTKINALLNFESQENLEAPVIGPLFAKALMSDIRTVTIPRLLSKKLALIQRSYSANSEVVRNALISIAGLLNKTIHIPLLLEQALVNAEIVVVSKAVRGKALSDQEQQILYGMWSDLKGKYYAVLIEWQKMGEDPELFKNNDIQTFLRYNAPASQDLGSWEALVAKYANSTDVEGLIKFAANVQKAYGMFNAPITNDMPLGYIFAQNFLPVVRAFLKRTRDLSDTSLEDNGFEKEVRTTLAGIREELNIFLAKYQDDWSEDRDFGNVLRRIIENPLALQTLLDVTDQSIAELLNGISNSSIETSQALVRKYFDNSISNARDYLTFIAQELNAEHYPEIIDVIASDEDRLIAEAYSDRGALLIPTDALDKINAMWSSTQSKYYNLLLAWQATNTDPELFTRPEVITFMDENKPTRMAAPGQIDSAKDYLKKVLLGEEDISDTDFTRIPHGGQVFITAGGYLDRIMLNANKPLENIKQPASIGLPKKGLTDRELFVRSMTDGEKELFGITRLRGQGENQVYAPGFIFEVQYKDPNDDDNFRKQLFYFSAEDNSYRRIVTPAYLFLMQALHGLTTFFYEGRTVLINQTHFTLIPNGVETLVGKTGFLKRTTPNPNNPLRGILNQIPIVPQKALLSNNILLMRAMTDKEKFEFNISKVDPQLPESAYKQAFIFKLEYVDESGEIHQFYFYSNPTENGASPYIRITNADYYGEEPRTYLDRKTQPTRMARVDRFLKGEVALPANRLLALDVFDARLKNELAPLLDARLVGNAEYDIATSETGSQGYFDARIIDTHTLDVSGVQMVFTELELQAARRTVVRTKSLSLLDEGVASLFEHELTSIKSKTLAVQRFLKSIIGHRPIVNSLAYIALDLSKLNRRLPSGKDDTLFGTIVGHVLDQMRSGDQFYLAGLDRLSPERQELVFAEKTKLVNRVSEIQLSTTYPRNRVVIYLDFIDEKTPQPLSLASNELSLALVGYLNGSSAANIQAGYLAAQDISHIYAQAADSKTGIIPQNRSELIKTLSQSKGFAIISRYSEARSRVGDVGEANALDQALTGQPNANILKFALQPLIRFTQILEQVVLAIREVANDA